MGVTRAVVAPLVPEDVEGLLMLAVSPTARKLDHGPEPFRYKANCRARKTNLRVKKWQSYGIEYGVV